MSSDVSESFYIMDYITLYNNGDIQLDMFDDGTYRITMFKNHHWNGDFTFNANGIIHDDLTEDNLTLQEILEMLPPCIEGEPIEEFETSYSLNIDFSSKEISYYDHVWDRELISFDYTSLLDGAFQMLKWCKENKYI